MTLIPNNAANGRTIQTENTQLVYGENATLAAVKFFNNTKNRLNICVDNTIPAADIQVLDYYKTLKKLRDRGIQIRYVTEITEKNIHYCKQISEEIAEVRHLDGVKTNFGVNESEYMAASFGSEGGKPLIQLIYSNVTDIVSQQQYVFETLWNKAIPAKQRIKEIEQGLKPERTEVINGVGETTDTILQLIQNAKNKLDGCGDQDAAIRISGFQPYKKAIFDARSRGVKIRSIIDITKGNIHYCKELLTLVDECRHLDGIKINNAMSEDEYIASILNERPNVPYLQIIYSNSKEVVAEQSYVFEALWQKAIPAKERIMALEEGIEAEYVEVINDGEKIESLFIDLAKSIRKEAQLILSKPKIIEVMEKLGLWDYLIRTANDYGAEIRVISPMTEETSKLANQIMNKAPNIKIIAGPTSSGGLLIQDEDRYIRSEDKDVDASDETDVISRIIYSNSQNGIKSFRSIFETLWKQSQLYEQLTLANEKLIQHDQMQREFINVAAHELRTPIQPILVSAELLEMQLRAKGRIEITQDEMEIIIRNARRLERLSSDLLTVSRIESQSLKLNKEDIDLREIISSVIGDARSYIRDGRQLKVVFEPAVDDDKKSIVISADRSKLYEVLSNLLKNAIRFTESGAITVSLKRRNQYAIVSVKDTGKGIDPNIMPRLFEKFVTNSANEGGTGLGLFVSKAIVEAHSGKMWGENNKDGKGATFTFSLPLS